MKIRFERVPGRYMPFTPWTGDPVIRDWPFIPPEGTRIELDVGEDEPYAGNVRGTTIYEENGETYAQVRIS